MESADARPRHQAIGVIFGEFGPHLAAGAQAHAVESAMTAKRIKLVRHGRGG